MFRETAKFVFVMPLQDPEWNPDGTQIDDMAAAFAEIMDQFVDVISDSDGEPASCGGLALDPPASDPDASSLAKNQDRHYSRVFVIVFVESFADTMHGCNILVFVNEPDLICVAGDCFGRRRWPQLS